MEVAVLVVVGYSSRNSGDKSSSSGSLLQQNLKKERVWAQGSEVNAGQRAARARKWFVRMQKKYYFKSHVLKLDNKMVHILTWFVTFLSLVFPD